MTLALLLLLNLAHAHGGEDHGAPAPSSVTIAADATSVTVASEHHEGVLRVKLGAPGTPVPARLLLTDFATSAPISDAVVSLTLAGPAEVQADLTASTPVGAYAAELMFGQAGSYAGALAVSTPETSDLLAVADLDLHEAAQADLPGAPTSGLSAARAGTVALAAGLLGVVLGLLLGRRRRAAAVAVAVGLGLAGQRVWAHGGEEHDAAPSSAKSATPSDGALTLPLESALLVGLRTQRATREPFQEQAQAIGHFVSRPGEGATLRAPVSGRILAPAAGFPAPGAEVKAGEVLAILDESASGADRAAVAEQRATAATELATAKRQLALAERDAASVAALGQALSDRERLDRAQSLAVARVAVDQAQAALDVSRDGLKVLVRAPFSGRLGAFSVRPGDQVELGAPLFRVADPKGLWIEASLPERFAAAVRAGAPATVLTQSDPGHPLQASVLDAGQEADPRTGSVRLTLAVLEDAPLLLPGMSATVWVGLGAPTEALVVADSAVVNSGGTNLVFVKIGAERFEMREVALGGRAGDAWEVREGLRPGERVVTEGTYTLRSLAGR